MDNKFTNDNLLLSDLIKFQLHLFKSLTVYCFNNFFFPIHKFFIKFLQNFIEILIRLGTKKTLFLLFLLLLKYKYILGKICQKLRQKEQSLPNYEKLTKFFQNKLKDITFENGNELKNIEKLKKRQILAKIDKLLSKDEKENTLFTNLMKYYISNYKLTKKIIS
jgi:hypothetical protein